MAKIFKVHTDELGRLIACLQKSMYGVSRTAFTQELPPELRSASVGDIVFISERKICGNALFGPLYIVGSRQGIVPAKNFGSWVEINVRKSDAKELAYWVDLEKRNYCLLFDKLLSDRISIVWPNDWARIGIQLPPWGIVTDENAHKLIDFAVANEQEARSFFQKHRFW